MIQLKVDLTFILGGYKKKARKESQSQQEQHQSGSTHCNI
jgi:hypothetical protein